jgi:hypothetical protein
MESELYKKVYQIVTKVYRKTNLKRIKFTDADITLTYLWAVLHDRPTCWACNKKSWPIYYRRKALPDASTMCRRLKTIGVQQLLKSVEKYTTEINSRSLCRWIDGKALRISNISTDSEAGYGYATGGMGKGYRLHAIADIRQGFITWKVLPMQRNEGKIAEELIPHIDDGGYLIGDSAYEKNPLYELGGSKSIKLFAPKRQGKRLGHHRHSKYRLKALPRLGGAFVNGLLKSRWGIERMFGQLTNFSCGLKPLPNWVRTLRRVEMWVRAKIIFFHLWRLKNV